MAGITDIGTNSVMVQQHKFETRSAIVDTAAVTKGMVLIIGATGHGYAQPATASANNSNVLGIALNAAAIGGTVTFVLPPVDVRVILAEGQTLTEGDELCTGTSTIGGVTSYGRVIEIAKPADAAGANPTAAEYAAFIDYTTQKIGVVLEDKSTGADEEKVVKIRFTGR